MAPRGRNFETAAPFPSSEKRPFNMTMNLHRTCITILLASSFSSAHKNVLSYRRVGQNGETGAWKASIDRSWSCGDEGTAVRPAAELAAVAAVAEAAADRIANREHSTASVKKGQIIGLDEHQRMEIGFNSRGGVAMEGCDGGKDEAPGKAQTEEGGSQSLAFSLPAATRSRMLTARDSPSATSVTAAAASSSTDRERNVELPSRSVSSGKGEQRADGREGVVEVGSTSAESRDSGERRGNASAASGAGQDQQRVKCAKEVGFCRLWYRRSCTVWCSLRGKVEGCFETDMSEWKWFREGGGKRRKIES